MSGPHRKVSRSLDTSSGFITSRSHLTQPENELKQKLNAIDSSIKISNKKINNETRELRQILYDLQRDLKVSKSVSHYVPSPIEEHETKRTKRARRVTVATTPRELQRAEVFSNEVEKDVEEVREVTQGFSTKRRRKTSVPPVIKGKILVSDDDDVFEETRQELAPILSKGKTSGVGENHHEVQEDEKLNKREHSPDSDVGHCDDDAAKNGAPVSSAFNTSSGETSQEKPSNLSFTSTQVNSNNTDMKPGNTLQTHKGIPSIYSQERGYDNQVTKGNLNATSVFSNPRNDRRSLSESEAAYRETFKGRFVTSSLALQSNHARGILPPPDPERRSRRITVAGCQPLPSRRRVNVGDIPVTPFHSGSRRIGATSMRDDGRTKSRPLGRAATGGNELSLDRGSEDKEMNRSLLANPSRDTPRYRRTSKVSSLPPLKEERAVHKAESQEIPREWQNLENCRYLRKDEYEISIEDIFKKD